MYHTDKISWNTWKIYGLSWITIVVVTSGMIYQWSSGETQKLLANQFMNDDIKCYSRQPIYYFIPYLLLFGLFIGRIMNPTESLFRYWCLR